MPISYPRQFPQVRFAESTWFIDHGVVESRHAKGRVGTLSRIREPIWFARFQTDPIHNEDKKRWQAWFSSLGGINDFLAYDYSRKELRNYPNGVPQIINATWTGNATVTSLATPNQINLSGIPIGIVFKEGDRVGLVQSGKYGYYDILEDVTTGAGGTANLTVAPRVNTSLFTTAAVAVCYRPLARFRVRDFDLSFDSQNSGVSIEAVQIL